MASFSGFTPLHYAVVTGNKKMLETLLSYGADPLIANSRGLLPQAYASSKIAELLKEKEAQVSRSSQSCVKGSEHVSHMRLLNVTCLLLVLFSLVEEMGLSYSLCICVTHNALLFNCPTVAVCSHLSVLV